MTILTILLSLFGLLICSSGLLLNIIMLTDNNLNERDAVSVLSLCFSGFGWAIFLYASLASFSEPVLMNIAGQTLLQLGVFLWFYKNILKPRINFI